VLVVAPLCTWCDQCCNCDKLCCWGVHLWQALPDLIMLSGNSCHSKRRTRRLLGYLSFARSEAAVRKLAAWLVAPRSSSPADLCDMRQAHGRSSAATPVACPLAQFREAHQIGLPAAEQTYAGVCARVPRS
jgi:hypothetical protein